MRLCPLSIDRPRWAHVGGEVFKGHAARAHLPEHAVKLVAIEAPRVRVQIPPAVLFDGEPGGVEEVEGLG